MTNKYFVILIGNKGNLLESIYNSFLNDVNCNLTKYYYDDVEKLLRNNSNISDYLNLNEGIRYIVIYCGGEVRNEFLMLERNFTTPSLLAKQCEKNRYKFIYLSSLSVYEYFNKTITIDEDKNPYVQFSTYGITKKMLDDYITTNCNSLDYISIKPASIVGSKRLSSSLDKVLLLIIKYPFLKYFRFQSYISFIHMEEISNFIYYLVVNNIKTKNFILAHNIKISNLQNKLYKNKFYINVDFIFLIKIFFALNKIFKIKSLLKINSITNKNIFISKYKINLISDDILIDRQIKIIYEQNR